MDFQEQAVGSGSGSGTSEHRNEVALSTGDSLGATGGLDAVGGVKDRGCTRLLRLGDRSRPAVQLGCKRQGPGLFLEWAMLEQVRMST